MASTAQLQLIQFTPCQHWLTWQNDLYKKIDEVADLYDTYSRVIGKLQGATSLRIREYSAFEALQSAVHCWMDDKCVAVTKDNSDGSNLSITRDALKGGVGSLCREDVYNSCGSGSMSSLSASALTKHVKSSIDVLGFYTELMRCGQELVGRSRIQSAKDLSHLFDLSACSVSKECPLHIKKTRSFFVLPITIYNAEGHEVSDRLKRIQNHIKVMEFESGIQGVSDLLQSCIDTADSVGYFESVPSRTKVIGPNGGEAIFFNSSVKLHVPREFVHALIGFVREYATETRIREITLAE